MVDLSKYKDIYISETKDHLQKLNDNLLVLEKNPDDKEILNELMRSSHTIKGSSATMQYKKTAFLAHVMEDVFDYVRNDMLKITPKIINELFKSVDTLEKSINCINKNDKEFNCDKVSEKIKKITGVVTKDIGSSPRNKKGKPVKSVKKNIKKVDKSKTEDIFKKNDNILVEGEKITHIKVPVERLDILMDLMEELLIGKMKLSKLATGNEKLEELSNYFNRLISDIQYQVVQARMVPVEQVFARFPRMVRDLSQKKNKKVEFIVTGGDIELDRTIVDKLGEPLLHLLRNAVDHGIKKNGKIFLDVKREGEFALISVENEGNTIDIEEIKRVAIEKKIVTAKEIKDFDKKKVLNIIFNPRFSTKKEVTETSGRGVGLSVVKEFVDQVGGRAIVETDLPKTGVKFVLELPLTLAIINALLVESQGYVFAVPFSSIEKSVKVQPLNIKSMADQDVAVIDDDYVPLARLGKIFDLNNKPEGYEEREMDKKPSNKPETVVIVRRGKDRAGIVVDRLITEEEIIVKPLPSVLRKAKGLSGSTILGDGKTILIIDVVTLLEEKSKLLRAE